MRVVASVSNVRFEGAKMKYNTISSGSLSSEKKATFKIYADMDISQNKVMYTEEQVSSIRGELEIVQKALKLQTKRCRQLVAEYTRRLQEKEVLYQTEKSLRDDQLAKILKALLIFEARLKREQKYISLQLNEKDYIIKKQSNDIKKLLASQYCKNCNQYYSRSSAMESLDSSSEYVVTDYQSSNFESLDSSSETYTTLSEKNYNSKSDAEVDDKTDSSNTNIYQKNRNNKDSLGRRTKKIPHRKSIGTYFEVLKLRNESPISNEDNTSADYDNLDSLPSESITDKITVVSESIQTIFDKTSEIVANTSETSPNVSLSECENTVINNMNRNTPANSKEYEPSETNDGNCDSQVKVSKITETIPVFEGDANDANDNWYASASDQEDEDRRDVYRNNPVLECMNQILLQNINDNLNSPPKTPNVERKTMKNKRVKFSDEEKSSEDTTEIVKTEEDSNHGYYETPTQKTPNYYETPQSIYSNDYEQILSKCSETFSGSSDNNDCEKIPENQNNHHYIDMDNKIDITPIMRKSKILRTPPALPPKPPNLLSKYKMQNFGRKTPSEKSGSEFEPDYCSISELNLPQTNKINVVAEINAPTSHDVMNKLNAEKSDKSSDTYDQVIINDNVPSLVVKKCVEKLNIQTAKQTPIKSEGTPVKKTEPEIPKLPQVSEIIIPDENEEPKKEERITHDNYVKNNSQILKSRANKRSSIVTGTSVSSLIMGFNNNQILSEIKKKHEKNKVDKLLFSSFENLQNIDKHFSVAKSPEKKENSTFENSFDLSQNFEEFKLDDCEIEEYNVDEELNDEEKPEIRYSEEKAEPKPSSPSKPNNVSTRVELVRATNDNVMPNLNRNSIELLKKQLEVRKQINEQPKEDSHKKVIEPTYEHFLECTGLSSKSILTPSRLLSNHKGMLKPKDVKLRSKARTSNHLFERSGVPNVKYWSEPFV